MSKTSQAVRAGTVTALAVGATWATCTPASAETPQPSGIATAAPAIVQAGRSPALSAGTQDTLRGFFAAAAAAGATGLRPGVSAPTGPARLAPTSTPVYLLSADFTRTGRGPVASLGYVATAATGADGSRATVWTAPSGPGGAWSVVNVAVGDDETRHTAAAAADPAFQEPQLNAWYVVRGGRVLPLNDEARRSVGARGLPVVAYQRLVHRRYAARMGGSAYDRAGLAGGYGTEMTAPVTAAAASAAGPADDRTGLLAAGAGTSAAALIGLAVLRRRRPDAG